MVTLKIFYVYKNFKHPPIFVWWHYHVGRMWKDPTAFQNRKRFFLLVFFPQKGLTEAFLDPMLKCPASIHQLERWSVSRWLVRDRKDGRNALSEEQQNLLKGFLTQTWSGHNIYSWEPWVSPKTDELFRWDHALKSKSTRPSDSWARGKLTWI